MSFGSLAAWGLHRRRAVGPAPVAGALWRGFGVVLQGRSLCLPRCRTGPTVGRGGAGAVPPCLPSAWPGAGRGRPLVTAVTGLPVRFYWGAAAVRGGCRALFGLRRVPPRRCEAMPCRSCSSGGSPVMAGSTPVRSSVGDLAPGSSFRSRTRRACSLSDRGLGVRSASESEALVPIQRMPRGLRFGTKAEVSGGEPRSRPLALPQAVAPDRALRASVVAP